MSDKEQALKLVAQLEAAIDAAPLYKGAADTIKQLLAENEAQAAMVDALVEDFLAYATDGVVNPAPYCINRREECCARPGWCAAGSPECRGFYPAAATVRIAQEGGVVYAVPSISGKEQ